MSESAMREAYSAFLRSAELHTWEASLESFRAAIRDTSVETPLPRLVEGLCIAVFTRWHASLCGETRVRASADAAFEEFARAAGAYDLDQSRDGIVVNSVIAAGRGYHETAGALIRGNGLDVPLEVQLLIMPNVPAKRARALKERVPEGGIGRAFLPAVYFYAHALLDLGYLEELEQVLKEAGRQTSSLMVDLKGKLHELRGAWEAAYEIYKDSHWDQHKYRASICSIIAHASGDGGKLWLAEDATLERAMMGGGAESDQAEAIRSASFVNACRWDEFDSWLVHYELGSLSFRRRRHAEADEHLRVAAQRAPASFRFAINHLRFVNLTWLTGSAKERSLPVEPEMLECGHAALAARGDESYKTMIRIHVAEHTGDLSVLETSAEAESSAEEPDDDLFAQGNVYEVKGWAPDALKCWSAAIAEDYVPRAFDRLIRLFDSFGFEATTDHLVEIALLESWDDFFQLWELGQTMLRIGADGPEVQSARPKLADAFSRIEQRVAELADNDFQHLIRAWSYYSRYHQAGLAARVLARASQLAESAEEHLLLAVARRPKAGETDRLGLESLLRAEREATHRLARLEIARELVRYGQVARARQVLKSAGVFEVGQRLEPIEYVLVLECGRPCLTGEEANAIAKRAMAELTRDMAAGLYAKCGDEFVERLHKAAAAVSANLGAWGEDSSEAVPLADSVWQSWKSSLEKLDDPELLDETRRQIESELSRQGESDFMLFFNMTLWGYLHQTLEVIVADIKRIRPDRPAWQTPISRSDSMAVNERAKIVTGLWREYLTPAVDGRAGPTLDRVQSFYRDEERLEREWESLRVKEMQAPLEKARYLLEYGRSVLALIRDDPSRTILWPSFLGLGEHLAADTQTLDLRLVALMSGTEAPVVVGA